MLGQNFEQIVAQIRQIGTDTDQVADGVGDQTDNIRLVTKREGSITEQVNRYAATPEETAGCVTDLAGQGQQLRRLVETFSLSTERTSQLPPAPRRVA